MRVLAFTFGGKVSKKRSMSMVLPLPTSPYMYRPFGRLSGIGGSAEEVAGLEEKNEKRDFLGGGWRDSMVGWTTGGCS